MNPIKLPEWPRLAAMGFLAAMTGCTSPVGDPSDLFITEVKPVLEYYCIECHTDQSSAQFGGFSLETGHSAKSTGRHRPVIIPGNPDASLLYQVLRFGHEDPLGMPPAPDKISDRQLAAIRSWISAGAQWPENGAGHLTLPR